MVFCSIASALAMLLREPGRWNTAKAAVGPDLIEVLTPSSDRGTDLGQRLKPVLVQALVAELAVEALDVAVLRRATWFDQDVPNAWPWAQVLKIVEN